MEVCVSRSRISLIWENQRERTKDILVGADTGSFKSWRGKLFQLVGDHVHAHGEVIGASLLTTQVEDTDLRVGDTTVEPRLGVRLLYQTSPVSTQVSHQKIFFFLVIKFSCPFSLVFSSA